MRACTTGFNHISYARPTGNSFERLFTASLVEFFVQKLSSDRFQTHTLVLNGILTRFRDSLSREFLSILSHFAHLDKSTPHPTFIPNFRPSLPHLDRSRSAHRRPLPAVIYRRFRPTLARHLSEAQVGLGIT